MKDELTTLYMEAVRNPKQKTTADTSGNKKGRTGTMEAGEDFGFEEAGTQKGTGPENVKGLQKPKKANKTITEDSEVASEENTEEMNTPEIGSKFDELFNQTIKEEFEEAGHPDSFSSGAADMGGDDISGFPQDGDSQSTDDTGEEVSLKSTLSHIISLLQDVVDNVEGDDENGENGAGEEGGGDIESLDTASSEQQMGARPFGEASANAQGKGDAGMDKKRDGVMRKAKDFDKGLQGKDNKVTGYYGHKTMKGQPGETGMSKPRDGVLRKAPDFDKGLQGKDNKVKTSSVMSQPGANLFD